MAKKQDFTQINTGRKGEAAGTAGKVYGAVEQAISARGQQGTASPQEAARRAAEGTTQGRKGCKATRINMAFTTDNYEFIRVMARATGRSYTEFTNEIIAAYRKEHPEFMEQANSFLQFVNSGAFSKDE